MKAIKKPPALAGPVLPLQPITADVLAGKYCQNNETKQEEIWERTSDAIASVEPREKIPGFMTAFYGAQRDGFILAGRINAAAGTSLFATLMNCFVVPLSDDIKGIFGAVSESGETMSRGGGVGYAFSPIRPSGALVKSKSSIASGPLSFMDVFDAMCQTVASHGGRRGAQMGVLTIDHPDIERFIAAKSESGRLTQFNISVAVTDDFLDALKSGRSFDLVHEAEPGDELKASGARQRADGMWVYKTVEPQKLWDKITEQTFQFAEPGILFIDNANKDNNLWYCETFAATNPCAEQFLPPYGCCCLGSINLTKCVDDPFGESAAFNFEKFKAMIPTAVRMLDNVLDITYWPLEQQRQEAMNKRRVGLGFTGLGDTLLMLNLKYDSIEGRAAAKSITEHLRNEAYRASVELAKEKGAFPLFDAEKYLESGFAKRLPDDIREAIAAHGIRNSHLLSIAPTGTISLAFADNASNGIEPAFSWYYTRKKLETDGSHKEFQVVDHAFRLYHYLNSGVDACECTQDDLVRMVEELPDHFVSALDISATDHLEMVAACQPFIDSSISKTVNVEEDYDFRDFQDLYTQAAEKNLKGLATYRPSDVRGSVLSVKTDDKAAQGAPNLTLNQHEADRRLLIDRVPEPVLESLRWPKRPKLVGGNPAWTYMVKTEDYKFAVFIGYTQNGTNHPFEVWVNGSEQPRGLGAIAKALSMDLRSNDRSFVKAKLNSLERAKGDDGCYIELPPDGSKVLVPSLVSAFAKLVKHCIGELEDNPPTVIDGEQGPVDLIGHSMTPMMDALMSPKEPKTGADGTMAWAVDVKNHATGDDFILVIKELLMPDGQRRPFSCWMSGEYPRVFDGLCKVLSYDMRIIDVAWIAQKLRSLDDFAEPMGDFLAPVPGSKKQQNYPSTVAYVVQLLLHRYEMLGLLDHEGYPVEEAGFMDADYRNVVSMRSNSSQSIVKGKLCPECSTYSVVKQGGCSTCTSCFWTGDCG